MPKKSASARGTAQRAKPKTPKNFELVRPVQDESQAPEAVQPTTSPEPVAVTTSTTASTTPTTGNTESTSTTPATSMSAASRLAARRQTSQQRQQRNTPTLITTEHYNYVRKDLIYIAILAVIMLIAIIVLYFVLGVNA